MVSTSNSAPVRDDARWWTKSEKKGEDVACDQGTPGRAQGGAGSDGCARQRAPRTWRRIAGSGSIEKPLLGIIRNSDNATRTMAALGTLLGFFHRISQRAPDCSAAQARRVISVVGRRGKARRRSVFLHRRAFFCLFAMRIHNGFLGAAGDVRDGGLRLACNGSSSQRGAGRRSGCGGRLAKFSMGEKSSPRGARLQAAENQRDSRRVSRG